MNAFVNSPVLPCSKVGSHFQVQETISEGHWHAICHTLVRVTVTCGNDNDIIGQLVLTDSTVQNQLIACSLNSWGCRVHFIEEENNHWVLFCEFFIGQIDGCGPVHLVDIFVEVRDASNISRLHLRHTQVNDETTKFIRNFLNNLRLADAGRAPQENRTLCLESFENSLTGLNGSDCEIVRNFRHVLSYKESVLKERNCSVTEI